MKNNVNFNKKTKRNYEKISIYYIKFKFEFNF